VNKSLSQSNDVIDVSGSLNNTGNGTLTVYNAGPALVAGDKFTLFNQPLIGGNTLTLAGGGAVWTNNLAVDGSISVLSTQPTQPVISGFVVSGSNVIISGTSGPASGTYNILVSTNLAQGTWTVDSTGTFSGSGVFSSTNAIFPGSPQKFYRLQLP
jgi:hypothetical protein